MGRYVVTVPSCPATSTTFPPRSVPVPLAQVTLFFLKRNSTPLVFCATTLSLRRIIVARSSVTPLIWIPCSAA